SSSPLKNVIVIVVIIITTLNILKNILSIRKIGTNHSKIVGAKSQLILNLKYKYIVIIYIIKVISKIFISVIYCSLLFNADIDIIPPNTITVIIAGTNHFSIPL